MHNWIWSCIGWNKKGAMNMKASRALQSVLEYLPIKVRSSIIKLPPETQDQIQEIRLRSCRPVGIRVNGMEQILTLQGYLTKTSSDGLLCSFEEIGQAFQAVCSYSVYSHERDISEGYVTIRGGCRVGICGTASIQKNTPLTLRNISGLNFRIAGEFIGTSQQVWERISAENAGILIAGSVGSGKTTFLRDLCRLIGNCYQTSLVDERGEIAAVYRGVPMHDIGLKTDVLDGYPRSEGILTALRVMTPQYIICDEISTQNDVQAILSAAGCGVNFAASCHAGNMEELLNRNVLRPLFDAKVFRHCVFLENNGHVRSVRRLIS